MKKKTSITIDDGLWKKLKIHSVKTGRPMKEILERLIRLELKR